MWNAWKCGRWKYIKCRKSLQELKNKIKKFAKVLKVKEKTSCVKKTTRAKNWKKKSARVLK